MNYLWNPETIYSWVDQQNYRTLLASHHLFKNTKFFEHFGNSATYYAVKFLWSSACIWISTRFWPWLASALQLLFMDFSWLQKSFYDAFLWQLSYFNWFYLNLWGCGKMTSAWQYWNPHLVFCYQYLCFYGVVYRESYILFCCNSSMNFLLGLLGCLG